MGCTKAYLFILLVITRLHESLTFGGAWFLLIGLCLLSFEAALRAASEGGSHGGSRPQLVQGLFALDVDLSHFASEDVHSFILAGCSVGFGAKLGGNTVSAFPLILKRKGGHYYYSDIVAYATFDVHEST